MPRNGSGVYSKPAGTTAVPNSTVESAKYNETIDDLVADANAARPITAGGTSATSKSDATTALEAVSYGAAQTLTATQQTQARTNIGAALKGYIYDLNLSNSISDSVNDIDISAGECASTATSPVLMQLNSTLTKRLDAAWAVGNGNGGLDTGSIANTTYHVFLIQRSDTGVVDALFSTNATSPTMPANYDRRRRIGSIIRSSGTIVGFTQRGDYFLMPTIETRNSTSTTANSLITCPTPLGIRTSPMFDSLLTISGAGSDITNGIGSGDSASPTFSFQRVFGGGGYRTTIAPGMVFTDRNSQVRFSVAGSGTITSNLLGCSGWIDFRGRNGGD